MKPETQNCTNDLGQRSHDEDNVENSDLGASINANTQERIEQAGSSMTGNFITERVDLNGRTLAEVRRELNRRIAAQELDAYLVFPADILHNPESKPAYYGRNIGDVITLSQIQERLNLAVNRQRLILAGVDEERLNALSQPIDLEPIQLMKKERPVSATQEPVSSWSFWLGSRSI